MNELKKWKISDHKKLDRLKTMNLIRAKVWNPTWDETQKKVSCNITSMVLIQIRDSVFQRVKSPDWVQFNYFKTL